VYFLVLAVGFSVPAYAGGNTRNDSFRQAKRLLMSDVYFAPEARRTLYCAAAFDSAKKIQLPDGFVTEKFASRAHRVEFEHVVPAENFGRTFAEWRDGATACVSNKGKAFKGRKCAEKVNMEYRLMQADMFNLYPAIGAVNAQRSNYNFTMLSNSKSSFGSCDMQISNRKVQPPIAARGMIARTYLYMELSYPRYRMSASQRKLMQAWDMQHPVSDEECRRARVIVKLQGGSNAVMQQRCAVRLSQI
jgi:deoxyribonuclease-1